MKQGVMTLQLVALLGCAVSSVNASGDDEFFNPCMTPERFLPDLIFNANESSSCGNVATYMYSTDGENTTCQSDFYGSSVGITARGLYELGCCGDPSTTEPTCEGWGGDQTWEEGDWQPCVNSTHFQDGMALDNDDDVQMSCGKMAWTYGYMGVTDVMDCDDPVVDADITYGQVNVYLGWQGCCGTQPVKCAKAPMNPCYVPENFDADGPLSLGSDDDDDDDSSIQTCGGVANVLPYMFEDGQCRTEITSSGDDDDDSRGNNMRRMLSRRLDHDGDDGDITMTVSMMYQMMTMSGCCGESGRSACDTGVIDMDPNNNHWTRECGYPKKHERRMHPNDMMTTVLALDTNEQDSVGVIFGCMGEVPDAEYRVRVKMLEPAFFEKKSRKGAATKEDRETMIMKNVVTIPGSNLIAVVPEDMEEMLPGFGQGRAGEFTHIYKANVPLNGMSNLHFNKDIRQARVEVQRRLPAREGQEGPSKWLVDHCMKAASSGFIAQMMDDPTQGDDGGDNDGHGHDDDNRRRA